MILTLVKRLHQSQSDETEMMSQSSLVDLHINHGTYKAEVTPDG